MPGVLYDGESWREADDEERTRREQIRQVDYAMNQRLALDDEHREQLLAMLDNLATQLDKASMLASSIRRLETDRFARTLDSICWELGIDQQAEDRFEPDNQLRDLWDLLDTLGDEDGSLSDQADLCRELAERLDGKDLDGEQEA